MRSVLDSNNFNALEVVDKLCRNEINKTQIFLNTSKGSYEYIYEHTHF